MISIIVSKYHPTQIEILKKNIENTIGVPYELIVIENNKGQMGLCEVYNAGARQARYEILCYSHEDVEIQTVNWGTRVLALFHRNERLGLLGVAGSSFKSRSPSGWWYPNAKTETVFTYFIQSNRSKERADLQNSNPRNEKLSTVACVDGFWFCTPKKIALDLKFDENTFKGFHCYDIDYSLTVFSRYEVAVSFEILIKHFSEGCYDGDLDWINETLKLYRKWKALLPIHVTNLDRQILADEETKALDYFLKLLLQNNFSLRYAFLLMWSTGLKSLVGPKAYAKQNLKLIKKRIVSKPFNKAKEQKLNQVAIDLKTLRVKQSGRL